MNLRRVDWDTSDTRCSSHAACFRFERRSALRSRPNPPPTRATQRLHRTRRRLGRPRRRRCVQAALGFVAHGKHATPTGRAFHARRRCAGTSDRRSSSHSDLPQPFGDAAIAESWIQAIENAKSFIYIEDQYFRMPLVNAASSRGCGRCRRSSSSSSRSRSRVDRSGLRVDVQIRPLFSTQFPSRYHLFHSACLTRRYMGHRRDRIVLQGFDTHSKMFIVDDVFMSLGSANKNNRGIISRVS